MRRRPVTNSDKPTPKNRRLLVVFAVSGICFVIFGVAIQMEIIPLQPGDGMLNIICGLIILVAIPFMWKR
jgi:hypothetical protein